MYLSAFSHRDQLYEITNRWFSDKLAEEDPVQLSKIVTYDSFIAWQGLRQLSRTLYSALWDHAIFLKPIYRKKDLKDQLSQPGMDTTPRLSQLMRDYRRHPEYYYTGSAVTGYIIHDSRNRMLGVARAKRPKRIAEKASRYAARFIARQLREIAASLADGSQPEGHTRRLADAERQLMDEVRHKGLVLPKQAITIEDILGLKVVDWGAGESWLEAALKKQQNLVIREKEHHRGNYNATHYLVEQALDFAYIRNKFNRQGLWFSPRERGLPDSGLAKDFDNFLTSSQSTIRIDLILTTFEELVESEIGRSMHETRIFKQRSEKVGNICTNIEYIIEFLLAVALSPARKIDHIPIKVWGRYLPDTLSENVRRLHQMPATLLLKH